MSYLLKELALLLLGWVIFVQTRNWLHWRGVKKLGDANACEDPPALPNKLPGGIERYSLVLFGYGGSSHISPCYLEIVRLPTSSLRL